MTQQLDPHPRTARGRGLRRIATAAVLFALPWFLSAFISGCLPGGEAEQETFVLEIGPFELPASQSHHEAPQPAPLYTTSPVSGWIHGFRIEVVDEADRPVPMEVMHHLKVMSPERRELFDPFLLRIAGGGMETREARMPGAVGYRIHQGDSLLMTGMAHNPFDEAYHGVRFRVRLWYTPEGASPTPLSVYPFSTLVTPPGVSGDYDLPPGRSEKSLEVSPAIAGRIIGLGGHLHRYGAGLRLEDVTTGELLWETTTERDAEGHILEIPRKIFLWKGGLEIHPDHVYRVTAIYENPTGEMIPKGAMGTVGGVFRPADEADWPAVNRQDPLYQWDLQREINPHHGEHHMAGEQQAPPAEAHEAHMHGHE